jgi:hypothetical protein
MNVNVILILIKPNLKNIPVFMYSSDDMETYLIIIAIVLDILSIAGMQLNATGKIRKSFWVWLIANVGWIAYDCVIGEFIPAMLFVAYTIQCVFGLTRRKKNGEEKNTSSKSL